MKWFGFVRAVIVPACVYQSVAIAGATGTGRDVVEYFSQYGSKGGLYGIVTVTICLSILVGLAFEFARLFRAYDYQSFAKHLIGPVWPCFEIVALVMMILVVSVVAAAAGTMMTESFGLPYFYGLLLMLGTIAVLAFFGRDALAQVMVFWSVVLYLVLFTYFVLTLTAYQGSFIEVLSAGEVKEGWDYSSFKFVLYNSVLAPMMIYATRGIQTRAQAFTAGTLGVVLSLLPSLMFHFSFLGEYPDILERPVPVHWMLTTLDIRWLVIAYVVVLLGTFVETGAGMVQMVNERIDNWCLRAKGKKMPRWFHVGVGVGCLLGSALLAQFGVITLIGKGYGTIAWAFMALYVIPLISIGLYRIIRHRHIKSCDDTLINQEIVR